MRPTPPVAQAEKPAFRIVGYLPEYRLAKFNPDDAQFITDLVYFEVDPHKNGDAGLDRIKPETLKLLKGIKAKHGTRLHICLGGWNHSKGFPELSANAIARKRLIQQLTDFCRTHGFDGVDVDWEHPTKPNELKDHAKLLTEMKIAFGPQKLQLSVALAGWQDITPRRLVQSMSCT